MRIPTRHMVGNLRFTRSGVVWADFVLTGIPYGLRPDRDKLAARVQHEALLRALPVGEALLLGLVVSMDPEAVADRMMSGVDPVAGQAWLEECESTIPILAQMAPSRRLYWLSVPILGGGRDAARQSLRAGWAQLREELALPVVPPAPAEIRVATKRAADLLAALPGGFDAHPATPAQMVWLHHHLLERGVWADPALPGPDDLVVTKRGQALEAPLLDEGGQSDAPSRRERFNPFTNRVLKVSSTAGAGVQAGASYQAMLVVDDTPHGGSSFPGGELLGRLDECGLDVDWCVRLTTRSGREVLVANRRALRNLEDQLDQRDDPADQGVVGLENSGAQLAEYAGILESDKLEIEVSPTIVMTVAAASREGALTQAAGLAQWASDGLGYRLSAPIGGQTDLWWAQHPGVPTGPLVRGFAQITTSHNLAGLVPLASTRVGDERGILVGVNITNGPLMGLDMCGPTEPVFLDLAGATDANVSGSFAIGGDLGSGKSFLLKKIAGAIVDRGGRMLTADRTVMGEWAIWGRSLGSAKIVDTQEPEWSMDPLRLFGGAVGGQMAQSFLTLLLNVSPTDDLGVTLSEVLEGAYLERHGLSSLGQVLGHLMEGCVLPHAAEIARKANVFARKALGRVVFDPDLPPVDLGSDQVIVIRTHTWDTPSQSELADEHLFRQLTVEKIWGRAAYALVSAIAKEVCFSDRSRLAAFLVDEAHFVTGTDAGVRTLTDFVRDGRKHNALIGLASHDPLEDYPSEVLRGLIPNRILMRHTDPTLAGRGLEWLGLEASVEMVDLVTRDTSPRLMSNDPGHPEGEVPPWRRGEGLMRDSRGNVGRIRVLPPALRQRDQAARTGGAKDVA